MTAAGGWLGTRRPRRDAASRGRSGFSHRQMAQSRTQMCGNRLSVLSPRRRFAGVRGMVRTALTAAAVLLPAFVQLDGELRPEQV